MAVVEGDEVGEDLAVDGGEVGEPVKEPSEPETPESTA